MGFFDLFKRKFSKKYEIQARSAPEGEVSVAASRIEADKAEPASQSGAWFGSSVLARPVVTEKSTRLSHLGQYVFYVAVDASKGEVSESVKRMYGVEPTSVHVMRHKGENVVFRRQRGRTKALKKAIVTLPKGKSIDVMRQVKTV